MVKSMTSWRKEITSIIEDLQEELIECTLSDQELDIEFDGGFGGTEGLPFTAWTKTWVLFPICYDGAEWVGKAPRNPCEIKMEHQGG